MSIYISEIFGPTIQGEGDLIGMPTVFVRVGGCDFNCSWCDSKYAVDPKYKSSWIKMNTDEIFASIKKLTNNMPILVTLSGGNPAIYDFTGLIKRGKSEGFRFAMETQGSIQRPYFSNLDHITVSPKPPSSNTNFDPNELAKTLSAHPCPTLKIVIADEKDYIFAKKIHKKYPNIPMTIQPCNLNTKADDSADLNSLTNKIEWLINHIKKDGLYRIKILPQLHVFLWNNKRGV